MTQPAHVRVSSARRDRHLARHRAELTGPRSRHPRNQETGNAAMTHLPGGDLLVRGMGEERGEGDGHRSAGEPIVPLEGAGPPVSHLHRGDGAVHREETASPWSFCAHPEARAISPRDKSERPSAPLQTQAAQRDRVAAWRRCTIFHRRQSFGSIGNVEDTPVEFSVSSFRWVIIISPVSFFPKPRVP